MKLEQAKALEILDGENGKIISDDIIENTRWSIIHELIVNLNEKFYRTHYSVGATEYQDEGPWEYDKDVEFFEVEPLEVKVIKYFPIKAAV